MTSSGCKKKVQVAMHLFFLWKTKRKSISFELLIGHLAFVVGHNLPFRTPVLFSTSLQASNLLSFVAMERHYLWHAMPWSLDICSTQRSPVHRVQTHGASNRDTHLYSPHNFSSVHLTITPYVQRIGRITNGMRSGRITPQDSAFSSVTPAPTPRNDPPKKSLGPA